MHVDSQLRWKGQIPGDLRLVLHRLSKQGIGCYIVGPAVRDALLSETMDKVQRIDLVALAGNLSSVEKPLDSASASNIFLSKPERLRRASAFSIRDSESGAVVRRLVITNIVSEEALQEELARREVTVNAIAMDADGKVYDPFDGMRDLEKRLVRPVWPAAQLFPQRPLSLVKIAKHIAYHGYEADTRVEELASRHAISILDVPIERVRPELERLLVNRHPDLGLDFLERTGVMRFLLPEVQSTVGFSESCHVHHKDIWDHTVKVVAQSKPHAAIRWAALLHDIGKVWTRTVDTSGRVHFFRHEDMGANMFRGIAARFGLEERLAMRIHYLIQHHSRINMYTDEWTDSAVRRLMRDTGDYLGDLLSLSKADITSKQERKVAELTIRLEELAQRVERVREEDAKQPALPKGAGLIIMKHFGLPAGPVVGQLKNALEEAIEEGSLPAGLAVEDYMGFLQSYVQKMGRD